MDNYSEDELRLIVNSSKSMAEVVSKLGYKTRNGEKYNVSDNAVRKWCKGYGLPFRYGELHKYSA